MNLESSTSIYPLITIGIRVYNTSKEDIKRCFHSLFEQTYKDLEVFAISYCCIDDKTTEYINSIAKGEKCDNILRIVHHDYNQGCSISKNAILRRTHGISVRLKRDYISSINPTTSKCPSNISPTNLRIISKK